MNIQDIIKGNQPGLSNYKLPYTNETYTANSTPALQNIPGLKINTPINPNMVSNNRLNIQPALDSGLTLGPDGVNFEALASKLNDITSQRSNSGSSSNTKTTPTYQSDADIQNQYVKDNQIQMTPTQQYFALKGAQANDKLNNRGAYYVDPSMGLSPSQVEQVHNAADEQYNSQLQSIATDAKNESKSELTSGQTSAFNSIIGNLNRSPLIQAADRVPVLLDSIKKVRENPANGPLQLNLVYSYIQALDTYQSAVREGELALVNSIDSRLGQFENEISKIRNGQIVRPEVVINMANAAENIVNTINSAAKAKSKSYESQARAQGLGDIYDRYQAGYSASYNTPQNAGSAVVKTKVGDLDLSTWE